MWKNAHKDQRGTQVFVIFLDKVMVMIIGYPLEFVVELGTGVAGGPEKVRKEFWQRFEHSILQAENDRKKA